LFPIWQKLDKDGELLVEEDEDERFKIARAGDHLMIPFQCELCHFRNILGRDPDRGDTIAFEILDTMRRANLDAFWSQETSTVGSNLQEAQRMKQMTARLSLPAITPLMGPWELADNLGMKAAMAILDRSLDKGLYEDKLFSGILFEGQC
jgi:hypothetical protein